MFSHMFALWSGAQYKSHLRFFGRLFEPEDIITCDPELHGSWDLKDEPHKKGILKMKYSAQAATILIVSI